MSQINHNHVLSLLQTGFTTIQVSFEVDLNGDNPFSQEDRIQRARNRNKRERTYTYKAPLADNVQVGDLVIVDSPNSGLTICEVTAVDSTPKIDLSAPFPYKWIVQKVNRDRYEQLVKQEENFREALVEIERTKQREQVLKDFQERLPEGSEARKLFDATIESAKVLPHAQ